MYFKESELRKDELPTLYNGDDGDGGGAGVLPLCVGIKWLDGRMELLMNMLGMCEQVQQRKHIMCAAVALRQVYLRRR